MPTLQQRIREAQRADSTLRSATIQREVLNMELDGGIKIYLREIGKTDLLTPDQEVELAERIKRGDPEARSHMIRANLRLVVKIAQDYANYGLPLLDLKDLRAVISFLTSDEGKPELKNLGAVSPATAGVILRALINLGFGLALVFWPGISVGVLVWLIGLDFVIAGAIGLLVRGQMAPEFKSAITSRSIVTILFGIAIMVWPSATVSVVAFLVGALLVLIGLIFLWSGYQISKVRVIEV